MRNDGREDRAISRRGFIRRSGTVVGVLLGANPRRTVAAQGQAIDPTVPPELDSTYEYYCPQLVEITRPGPIILPDGTSQCSWSRRPYLDLNFEEAAFYPVRSVQRLRMKKWDMYHVITPDHYVSFLVAWIGYAAFCSAQVYDRRTRETLEDIHIRPADPEFPMMRDSTAGRTEYRSKKVNASFEVDGEFRRIRVEFPSFAGIGLFAEINLHHPADHESICGTHLTNPKRAHYGHKIVCMAAVGDLRLARQTYRLDRRDAFGMLDFGRGYYPDRTFWYWATTCGRDETGKPIGFNLGYGNSPSDEGENAVLYDGRLHKIGPTHCRVPRCDLSTPPH